MRPNHHYATDTTESIRDYGPLHGFWTFLFERLNKVLKSYRTNNHGGGELKTTFFREFHRTVLSSRLVSWIDNTYKSGLTVIVFGLYRSLMQVATTNQRPFKLLLS